MQVTSAPRVSGAVRSPDGRAGTSTQRRPSAPGSEWCRSDTQWQGRDIGAGAADDPPRANGARDVGPSRLRPPTPGSEWRPSVTDGRTGIAAQQPSSGRPRVPGARNVGPSPTAARLRGWRLSVIGRQDRDIGAAATAGRAASPRRPDHRRCSTIRPTASQRQAGHRYRPGPSSGSEPAQSGWTAVRDGVQPRARANACNLGSASTLTATYTRHPTSSRRMTYSKSPVVRCRPWPSPNR